ncbi:MAG: PAS domain S-box protein, partial [Gemmatales bacterium]|nr:PAS domain S-box protein [Gemmatales bacterium]MDW8386498.1 PAS domain S-box protein [Gemmatales bacterium]
MSWLRNLIGVVYTQVQVYRATVLPVLYVVGASLFTGLLGAWGEPIGFLPYILAVIVAAWLGGLYGGLLTTALSAGAITLGYSLAYQPAGQMGLQDFFLRLGLFAFMGGVASYLAMQCQRAVTAYDRLQKTLSNAREAWVFADVRGRVVFLNTQAQAWSGWHLAHARHRPLDQLFVLLHETTRKPIPIRLDEIVRQRHPVHLPEDAVLLTAGGSTIPVEGSIVPIQSTSDEVVEVLLMFREVSSARRAKKESVRQEGMADQLAESVPGGLLLLEADGKCVRVNSEAARLFGRGKDELLGHGWMRGLSSQEQEAVLSAVEEACKHNHAAVTTAELVSRTGTSTMLRMRFRAGFGEAPSCQVVALVEDVSQAKALERSLDQVRAESALQTQQLQEQIQRLQGERDELKSQLAEAKQKAEQERQTLAKQMEQLRAEIAAKPAHQPDLQLALQQAKQDLASERAKRETAEKARQEAEKAVQELEKELEQAWQQRESLEHELK